MSLATSVDFSTRVGRSKRTEKSTAGVGRKCECAEITSMNSGFIYLFIYWNTEV